MHSYRHEDSWLFNAESQDDRDCLKRFAAQFGETEEIPEIVAGLVLDSEPKAIRSREASFSVAAPECAQQHA
jgi:hypothetical protein